MLKLYDYELKASRHMLLDWSKQYCQNDYTIQNNLRSQWNFYQITSDLFNGIRIKKFTFCVQTQRTLNSQSNLKKNGAGEIKHPNFRL